MKCLSKEELKEFPKDTRVWVVLDKADPDTYKLFPLNFEGNAVGIVAFVEREDAEHMVRLLRTNDFYKNDDLGIRDDLLNDLTDEKYNYPLCVWNHDSALEFFTRYPDLIDGYKG